ncbi:hypothetical protein GCM10023235_50420 [Kitasatospora terrestris]|uniref:Uncharacterized protein n=1 Tax=Kitasatospora terrestris TaxID=258051 RepID=A0ABP9E315_9ACTN
MFDGGAELLAGFGAEVLEGVAEAAGGCGSSHSKVHGDVSYAEALPAEFEGAGLLELAAVLAGVAGHGCPSWRWPAWADGLKFSQVG